MKIRVFRTPSKSDSTEIHVGIPEVVQLDPDITGLEVSQVENLPAPTSLDDLSTTPMVIQNAELDAFGSIQKSTLQQGYSLRAVAVVNSDVPQSPIEIEEVQIPSGYVHIDDVDEWTCYNYNQAYFNTAVEFQPLPGEDKLPIQPKYGLMIKERSLYVKYSAPIDNIRVYYRRISEEVSKTLEFEWTFLASITMDDQQQNDIFGTTTQFPFDGKFVIRSVPCIGSVPIGGFIDKTVVYESDNALSWQSIQLSESSFLVRMEGHVSENVNYVEVREGDKIVCSQNLEKDANGMTTTMLTLRGLSNTDPLRPVYEFYRKKNSFKALVNRVHTVLDRNYAKEDIGFDVQKISPTKFKISILDPKDLLYSPASEIEPFSGQNWERSIQSNKLLVFLAIDRYQNGEKVSYGKYLVNVTQEKNLKFLEKPPFEDTVTKIGRGFNFEFEDTQEFREVRKLDNPMETVPITYEFRLLFWSTGVEECLRTGKNYAYIKEDSVTVGNKRRLYKRSYDTWSEEHPRRKYTGIIPVDPKYAFLNHHIKYGKSIKGFVHTAASVGVQRTRNFDIIPEGWKVIYYYNDKDDEIQEFPYYCFTIDIPPSSALEIEKLEVFVNIPDKKIPPTLLQTHHPVESIKVVDFIGYFQMMLSINSQIDIQAIAAPVADTISKDAGLSRGTRPVPGTMKQSANSGILQTSTNQAILGATAITDGIDQIQSATTSSAFSNLLNTSTPSAPSISSGVNSAPQVTELPAMLVNTAAAVLEAKISNTHINNAISQKVLDTSFQYRVDVHFRDGKLGTQTIDVSPGDRPRIPEDPPGNSSVSIGNKVFTEAVVQLPLEASAVVTDAIGQIEISSGGLSTGLASSSTTTVNTSNLSVGTATGIYTT